MSELSSKENSNRIESTALSPKSSFDQSKHLSASSPEKLNDRTAGDFEKLKHNQSDSKVPGARSPIVESDRVCLLKEPSQQLINDREKRAAELKPDVSGLFKFREYQRNNFHYKEAAGPLGVPGMVIAHRHSSEQRKISSRTGDDAGHLIGSQFGPPGDSRNLSLQNWVQNEGRGTFYHLEQYWKEQLQAGIKIHACVTDKFRRGDLRPIGRTVYWKETHADGRMSEHRQSFINPSTRESRVAQNLKPSKSASESSRVYQFKRSGLKPDQD